MDSRSIYAKGVHMREGGGGGGFDGFELPSSTKRGHLTFTVESLNSLMRSMTVQKSKG